jgi:uncharacterized membrane protein YiaA
VSISNEFLFFLPLFRILRVNVAVMWWIVIVFQSLREVLLNLKTFYFAVLLILRIGPSSSQTMRETQGFVKISKRCKSIWLTIPSELVVLITIIICGTD